MRIPGYTYLTSSIVLSPSVWKEDTPAVTDLAKLVRGCALYPRDCASRRLIKKSIDRLYPSTAAVLTVRIKLHPVALINVALLQGVSHDAIVDMLSACSGLG